ncbi:MAG: pyridoxamine 5'-phosphate oxidase family protein [Actinomycetota bacterium]
MTTIDDVRADSLRYGPLAYVATVSPSGDPHVAPVAVAWCGDDILTFVRTDSRKVVNVRRHPRASVHFAVGPDTNWDSCIVWGSVEVIDDDAGRVALWDQMGYDLSPFEPGGPTAPTHVFLRVTPDRALILRNYGIAGREQWRR